jgi:glycosyltransferase involved in cell wall biosynthesis
MLKRLVPTRLRRAFDLPSHRLRQAVLPRKLLSRRARRGDALSAPDGMRPTLYIDVAMISSHDEGTGIQRVVRALAFAIVQRPPRDWEIRFVSAERTRRYHVIDWPNGAGPSSADPIRAKLGDVFLGLDYSLNEIRWHRGQLKRFRRDGGSLWFLVHDLLPSQRPDWFSPNTVLRHRIWLDTLAALADGFLCNSEQTKADLLAEMDRYGLSPRDYRTTVLPMGHDINQARHDRGSRDPVLANRITALAVQPFFLKVGTLEPRKGHIDLIRAFDLLWARGLEQKLVFIGRLGWRVDALRDAILGHPEFGQRLIWLDDVDDADLIEAFRLSEGVIVASHAEGFGLPLIEALGRGKPVLARDIPVFRAHENLGVRYFPVDATAEKLADEIQRWRDAIRAGAITVRSPVTGWDESASELFETISGSHNASA